MKDRAIISIEEYNKLRDTYEAWREMKHFVLASRNCHYGSDYRFYSDDGFIEQASKINIELNKEIEKQSENISKLLDEDRHKNQKIVHLERELNSLKRQKETLFQYIKRKLSK